METHIRCFSCQFPMVFDRNDAHRNNNRKHQRQTKIREMRKHQKRTVIEKQYCKENKIKYGFRSMVWQVTSKNTVEHYFNLTTSCMVLCSQIPNYRKNLFEDDYKQA